MLRFVARYPYTVPLALALLLALAGWSTVRAVETSARAELASTLETTLAANLAALDVWLASQRAVAEELAGSEDLVLATRALAARFAEQGRPALDAGAEAEVIAARVGRVVAHHGYLGWRILDADRVCLAGSDAAALGRVLGDDAIDDARVARGETVVTAPIAVRAEDLTAAAGGVMAIVTRLRGEDGETAGTLALGIDAARTFARLLEAARIGETGETYAFSAQAKLLSPSRFEPELRQLGLLPDDPSVGSFMNIELRDPGGDLSAGHVPSLPLRARPLTRMAAAAIAGTDSIDLDGYRDYRGVRVIGAWRWLPELGLGVASEIDYAEAYAPLATLRMRLGALIGLLALAALGLLVYSRAIRGIQGDLAAARRLGRYRIEAVIGRGGMGTVYRARHALLRRPTAVKVLRPELSSAEAIARFEREAQVTSQLTHPNTIEIYDYGETPDGLFYYAMEYLDGATLREVVDSTGPLPEARVLAILLQVAGSIGEAHRRGVVHRDLKPSNVMLCDRGGRLDFVKVVDFGLVKPLVRDGDAALTDSRALAGTPLYTPPEVIRSGDASGPASDVYQIGAIGWYLLAGRHVFAGRHAVEVLEQHLNREPELPSAVRGSALDPSFEKLLVSCLAKDVSARPADANALAAALDAIVLATSWTQADAAAFWASWRARPEAEGEPVSDSLPIQIGDSLDIGDLVARHRAGGEGAEVRKGAEKR